MNYYSGLDVSLKETFISISDSAMCIAKGKEAIDFLREIWTDRG